MKSTNTNMKMKYKNFLYWGKCAFILMLCCFICFATTPVFAESPKKIRVGFFNNTTIVRKTDSGYSGYGYEYLMEIAKYTNWNYEFVEGSVEECMTALKKGEIDLVGPVQHTEEREKDFAYSDIEFGFDYPALYTLKSNSDFAYNDFEAFDGMTVGLINGNYCNVQFAEFAEKNKFTYTPAYYNQSYEAFEALTNGQVDAIIETKFVDQTNLRTISRFAVNHFYYVASVKNQDIIAQIDEALVQIRLKDMYYPQNLEQKHFGKNSLLITELTRTEREYVENNPTLRVVINPDLFPMEGFDKKTKEPTGINIALFQDIADISGFHLEYIYTDSYEQSIEYIKTHKADIISGDISLATKDFLIPTNAIAELPIAVLSNHSVLLNEQTTIAVPKDFRTAENTKDNLAMKPVFYDTLTDCFDALENQEVDSTLANIYIYDYLKQSNQYGDLKMAYMLNAKNEIKLYMSDSADPLLLSIMNKSITALSENALNSAVAKNTIERDYNISLAALFKKYYWVLSIPIILIIIICCIIFLYHRSKMTRQLEKLAYHDSLTGARSMEKFWKDSDILFAKYDCENYSLIYMDIDRFKYINDSSGYKTGNQILRITAECIQEMLYDYELFARLSADIFILLLKNTDPNQLSKFITRLQRNIQQTCILNKLGVSLTVSAGIYSLTKDENDFYVQLDRANLARKQIKGVHDKICAFYDDSMRQKLARESEITEAMQDALDHDEFIAYYQPKHDLKTGKLAGAEALVRWVSPEKGIIPPDNFIPLFERNGFVTKVDFHVYEQVCKLLRKLLDSGEKPCPISVNLSRVHARSRNFIQKLEHIANEYEIPHNLLELELTETAILGNENELKSIMNILKEKGFMLSMDDFGTGYSSLNLLKDLPVDILKIDRGFFNQTTINNKEKTVIQDIVAMAHHLDMRVVSEGVETDAQRQFLIDINADIAQGYLFSKPIPPDDFLAYFRKNK